MIIETQELKRWGNSLGVRLPKRITEQARVADGQLFSITLKGSSIVLTPTQAPQNKLSVLLRGITPELVGGEHNTGPAVGREIYE
jgi:antitoxin MazE